MPSPARIRQAEPSRYQRTREDGSIYWHWGKADFFCHPITGQWECLHCGRLLKNNHKDCECRK
jgi:hypothetical protein